MKSRGVICCVMIVAHVAACGGDLLLLIPSVEDAQSVMVICAIALLTSVGLLCIRSETSRVLHQLGVLSCIAVATVDCWMTLFWLGAIMIKLEEETDAPPVVASFSLIVANATAMVACIYGARISVRDRRLEIERAGGSEKNFTVVAFVMMAANIWAMLFCIPWFPGFSVVYVAGFLLTSRLLSVPQNVTATSHRVSLLCYLVMTFVYGTIAVFWLITAGQFYRISLWVGIIPNFLAAITSMVAMVALADHRRAMALEPTQQLQYTEVPHVQKSTMSSPNSALRESSALV